MTLAMRMRPVPSSAFIVAPYTRGRAEHTHVRKAGMQARGAGWVGRLLVQKENLFFIARHVGTHHDRLRAF